MGAGYKRWGESIEEREGGGTWLQGGRRATRKGERNRGSERGKQKERRKREGEHVVRGEDEPGGGEAWPVTDSRRRRKREKEKTAHGHRKSGALHSHAKSSDGGVCSHPGDVATKRTRLPSNHRYRQ